MLRTGEPLRVAGITDEMLQAEATDAEHLALLRETGLTALLAVPVRAGERILGVLVMGSTQSDRRLDDHVLELADALGRRIGEALRNARLYRERDEIAHVLSAGLAPDQALEVAGCEVALRYRPAGEGVEAGGDFYEVIDTPAGPIVVIGDVAGKGAPAAALSAVSRVTLRTAGRLTGDPRAALDELNHALRRREHALPLHRRRRRPPAGAAGARLRRSSRAIRRRCSCATGRCSRSGARARCWARSRRPTGAPSRSRSAPATRSCSTRTASSTPRCPAASASARRACGRRSRASATIPRR